jgi:hypothetical protein
MTLWQALRELLENPPKGSGAAYDQRRGATKILNALIRSQGMTAPLVVALTHTDDWLLHMLPHHLEPSDLMAFRMEFGWA